MPVSQLNVAAAQAIPWATIFAKIKALIAQYGPAAIPYIETFLAGLGLPAWVLPILDAIIEMLLGGLPVPPPTPPVKLDAVNCKCVP